MKKKMDRTGASTSFAHVSMTMIVVMMPLVNSQTITTTQVSMTEPPATTVYPSPPAITVNPSSPAITVYPSPLAITVNPSSPAISVNPSPPAITVNPSSPATTVYPSLPAITVNPPPAITVNPAPFLSLSEDDASNNYVFCEAEHYSEIGWYKEEGLFNYRPTRFGAGKILNFSTSFDFFDQGNYFCVAMGTGEFASRNASSTRVIVTFQGVDTYFGTLVVYEFEGSTQFQDEGSPQYSFEVSSSNYFIPFEVCVNALFRSAEYRSEIGLSAFAFQREPTELVTGDIIEFFYVDGDSSQSTEEVESNLRQIDFLQRCSDRPLLFTSLQSASFCQTEILEVSGDELLVDLTFDKTNIGMNASSKELCPSHSPYAGMPLASRRCEGDFLRPSFWQDVVVFDCFKGDKLDCLDKDENSDDSCVGQLFRFLEEEPVTDEIVEEISGILAEVTEKEEIDEDELIRVVEILELIVQVNSSSPEVTENVVRTVDNIINIGEDVYMGLVSDDFAPSRFVRALETQLTNLQMGESPENFTVVRNNVGAFALRLDEAILGTNVTFGSIFSMDIEDIEASLEEGTISLTTGTDDLMADILRASITLPSDVLDEMSFEEPNDTVPITFLVYRTGLLFMNNETYEGRQRQKVGSIILAATLEGQSITNLTNPVVTRFRLLPGEEVIEKNNRRCVFWNFSLADGFGAWSSEGCELINVSGDNNESVAECHCYHLTNFAVLLSPQEEESLGLRILSIIGCAVSIPALLITIFIFLAVKQLRQKVPQQILVNLCFALLGLYIIFLIYLSSPELSKVGCTIIGALIHYFCLASVAWMCVEATNMYLLFVKVFDATISGFLWKAMLAAWVIPMVIVVVSVSVKSDAYTSANNRFCFPQDRTATYYIGLLVFVGLMLVYNLVIFILVVRNLTCRRVNKAVAKEKRKEMLERVQNIIVIAVLLGLTWFFGFFGFLSTGTIQLVFDILFVIFNSFQGIVFFVLFVLRPANVRRILLKRCSFQLPIRRGRYTLYATRVKRHAENDDKGIPSNTDSTNVKVIQVTNV